MKKSIISIIGACTMAFLMMSSFKTIPSASASKTLTFVKAASEPVTFFTSATGFPGPTTITGTVEASGGVNGTGSYVMELQFLGNALHCNLILTFPTGTITIRMLCNLATFNGQWQILGGTGTYQNIKGNGSLVMPNETDEILTGNLH